MVKEPSKPFRRRRKWQGATWTPENSPAQLGDGVWCRACKTRHGYMTMGISFEKRPTEKHWTVLWSCKKTGNVVEVMRLGKEKQVDDQRDYAEEAENAKLLQEDDAEGEVYYLQITASQTIQVKASHLESYEASDIQQAAINLDRWFRDGDSDYHEYLELGEEEAAVVTVKFKGSDGIWKNINGGLDLT